MTQKVLWEPTDKQTDFLLAQEDEVLFGGAAGGGKSDAIVIDALGAKFDGYNNPRYRALLIRKTFPQLREIIDRMRILYPAAVPGAEYKEADKEWIFPSGAKVILGYCERDPDVYQYQGHEFQWIGIDELGHFSTPFVYEYLTSRLRSPDPTLGAYMRATCNPGPKWIMKRFGIKKSGVASEETLDVEGRKFRRRFIPSFLSDNKHLDNTGYRERLLQMPAAQRQQLLEGRWDVYDVPSAVYRDEMTAMRSDDRIRPLTYDSQLKVHTIWDLGGADFTSIIFVQRSSDGSLRVIDYIQDNRKAMDHYVKLLKDKNYNYGTDFLPHDGKAKNIIGISAEEIAIKLGRNVTVLANESIEEGIRASRNMFPRVFISDRCEQLIDCLQNYKYGINATTGAYTVPVHDEFSHGADAWRYMAMAE
jgi:hypothetical protein